MKRLLFIALALAVGMTGFAQRANQAYKSMTVTCPKPSPVMVKDGAQAPGRQFNLTEHRAFTPQRDTQVEESQIMTTNYDLQSNSALGNRIATWADGTASFVATWDHSGSTTYPERGTGYNYYDGTSFGDEPTERIESVRSGWPSIAACGNGEILVSHASGTNVYYRPTKGQGEWTYITNFPDVTWPRVICSGPNDQYVHIVAADQVANDNGVYINTIYYARSTDGGQTWSDMVEFPNVDNSESGEYRSQLSADDYVMASNGNDVAVLFGSYNTDVFYMISHDNGLTWERQIVAPFPMEGTHAYVFADYPNGMEYAVNTSDNSHSIAIDDNGVVHVAFALFHWRASDNNNYTYWPAYGYGIVYWNSEYVNEQGGHEIPLFGNFSGDANHYDWAEEGGLGYSLFPDRITELAEADGHQHLHLFGYVDEDGDGVVSFENTSPGWMYRSRGLATMPGISVDNQGCLAIIFTVWSETRICEETGFSYRSAYVTCKDAYGNWFDNAINLSSGFAHELDEVYSTFAAPRGYNGSFWVGYFADDIQGLYIDNNSQYYLTDNYLYAVKITPDMEGWGSTRYHITTSVNPTEAGYAYGSGWYYQGASCTLRAVSHPGYVFSNWTRADGMVVSTEETYTFTVEEDAAFEANFAIDTVTFEVTATANPSEGGQVFGAGTYVRRTTCTLTAQANEGYTFHYWTNAAGEIVSYNRSFSFTVTEDATYQANFIENLGLYVSMLPEYRNVILEEFTGRNCGYCPDGHRIANEIAAENPDRFWPINVHAGNYALTSYPNLNTPDGTTIHDGFSISGYPSGVINRSTSNAIDRGYWYDYTYDQLYQTAECNIAGVVEIDSIARTATITVEIYYTGSSNYAENYLTVAMLQDSIFGSQADNGGYNPAQWVDGQYVHMHALRDIITEAWGDPITTTTEGSFITRTFTYQIPETIGDPNGVEVDLNNIYFLAWVTESYQGTPTRPILNACKLQSEMLNPYHWEVNVHQYANNMNAIGIIQIDGVEQNTAMLEIGAFSGDECRGRGRAIFIPELDRYLLFLTLFGEDGDEITFRLYDHNTDEELDLTCPTTVTFATDEILGTPYDPVVFEFLSHFEITATVNPEECGTVTGAGTYNYGDTCTLVATPAENYAFVNWTLVGEVVSNSPTFTFTVTEDASYVANFELTTITQTTNFTQGWNWWSTNVEADDLFDQLKTDLGANAQQIKSSTAFVNYFSGYWVGALTNINNESCYLINNNNACTIEMTGMPALPANHPITINPNWNWIGYPNQGAQSVANAFSNFNPVNGDQVKSQSAFSTYYSGIWVGGLQSITPGMGLLYKSNNTESAILIYPEVSRSEEIVENVTADNNHWVPDMHAYPNNMTVMAVVELDDEELSGENYELAAFANGECRGSARLMYVAPLNRHMAFLTVTGDEAAELSFSLFDSETGMEYFESNNALTYTTDATVGDLDEPLVVRFRGTTGLSDIEGNLHVYPNPVKAGERFSIALPASSKVERVEIVNVLGAVVSVETSTKAPASILAPNTPGVYTLRVTVENKGSYSKKLVVK